MSIKRDTVLKKLAVIMDSGIIEAGALNAAIQLAVRRAKGINLLENDLLERYPDYFKYSKAGNFMAVKQKPTDEVEVDESEVTEDNTGAGIVDGVPYVSKSVTFGKYSSSNRADMSCTDLAQPEVFTRMSGLFANPRDFGIKAVIECTGIVENQDPDKGIYPYKVIGTLKASGDIAKCNEWLDKTDEKLRARL